MLPLRYYSVIPNNEVTEITKNATIWQTLKSLLRLGENR